MQIHNRERDKQLNLSGPKGVGNGGDILKFVTVNRCVYVIYRQAVLAKSSKPLKNEQAVACLQCPKATSI